MNKEIKLSSEKLNELVLRILELPLSETLVKKFSLNELEQALSYYTSQRQILIESKDIEKDGYYIEKINGELSGIKVETVKINKAIAELKKKPKKVKKIKDVFEFNPTSINVSDEELKIIQSIKDCRTIPDITDKFDLTQINCARNYFKALRQSIIDQQNSNSGSMSANEFNDQLRVINNEISRTNKAITMLEQRLAKENRSLNAKTVEIESSYNFLKNFFNIACEQLDEVTFARFKAEAESKLNQRDQGEVPEH